ncbi:pyridoxal-5-phosphate-dependent protein subunit beta, partial [candidate division WOR-3 bacterium]|nr:pyridoxal-5-phosphate-dependent protein subunit beta [candidate division WOR-3 bacterium]
KRYLREQGILEDITENLNLLGISSIGNMIAAIKFAKYYELTDKDVILTVFTDSMELYDSRLEELNEEKGIYKKTDAIRDFELLMNLGIDYVLELSHYDKKRIHNLKYYTWVEQQGRNMEELNKQWYNHREYWAEFHNQVPKIDKLINEFNERVGLI